MFRSYKAVILSLLALFFSLTHSCGGGSGSAGVGASPAASDGLEELGFRPTSLPPVASNPANKALATLSVSGTEATVVVTVTNAVSGNGVANVDLTVVHYRTKEATGSINKAFADSFTEVAVKSSTTDSSGQSAVGFSDFRTGDRIASAGATTQTVLLSKEDLNMFAKDSSGNEIKTSGSAMAVDSKVRLIFSQSMTASSITTATTSFTCGGSAVTYTVSEGNNTDQFDTNEFILSPGANLTAGATCAVTVTGGASGVTAMSTSTMVANKTFTFSTPSSASAVSALTLVSKSVTASGTWTPTASGITATFDNIDCTTATSTNITLVNSASTSLNPTVSCDATTDVVTITVTNNTIASNQTGTATLTLGTGLKSASGGSFTGETTNFTIGCFNAGNVIGDDFTNDTITGGCWTSTSSTVTSVTGGEMLFSLNSVNGPVEVYQTLGSGQAASCNPFCAVTTKITENSANDYNRGADSLQEAIGSYISSNGNLSTAATQGAIMSHGTNFMCFGGAQCFFPSYWEDGDFDGASAGNAAAIGAALYLCLVQTNSTTTVAYSSTDGTSWTQQVMLGGFNSGSISSPYRVGLFGNSVANTYTEGITSVCINTAASNGTSADCCNPDSF